MNDRRAADRASGSWRLGPPRAGFLRAGRGRKAAELRIFPARAGNDAQLVSTVSVRGIFPAQIATVFPQLAQQKGMEHFPRANSNRARRSSGPALSPAAGEYCARQQGRTRAALPSTACGSRFLLARSGTLRTLRQSGGPLLCPGSACTRFRLLPGLRRFSGKRMQAQLARRPAPAGEADGNGRLLGGTESVIPFSSRIAPKKGEAGCLTPFCSILTAR